MSFCKHKCGWDRGAYKYNGNDREYHNGFGLNSRGYSFIATDSCFQHICLLLFKIQKILELKKEEC